MTLRPGYPALVKWFMAIWLILSSIIIIGCSQDSESIAHSTHSSINYGDSIDAQALTLYRSINENDVESIKGLIELPFYVREQTYISAEDGIGFILGSRSDFTVVNAEQLEQLLATLWPKITLANHQLYRENLLFDEELKGIEDQWRGLTKVFYVRGLEDVEHIVLMGFDHSTQKLRALYFN